MGSEDSVCSSKPWRVAGQHPVVRTWMSIASCACAEEMQLQLVGTVKCKRTRRTMVEEYSRGAAAGS
jgi:hypothetical protein